MSSTFAGFTLELPPSPVPFSSAPLDGAASIRESPPALALALSAACFLRNAGGTNAVASFFRSRSLGATLIVAGGLWGGGPGGATGGRAGAA